MVHELIVQDSLELEANFTYLKNESERRLRQSELALLTAQNLTVRTRSLQTTAQDQLLQVECEPSPAPQCVVAQLLFSRDLCSNCKLHWHIQGTKRCRSNLTLSSVTVH